MDSEHLITGSAPLHQLLADLIDYAGLFPPASLPLADVVRNYADYRKSASRFALARIIIPVGRLAEFSNLAEPFWADDAGWRVSALAPAPETHAQDFSKGLQAIEHFNQLWKHSCCIDVIETKAMETGTISRWSEQIGENLQAFWELPHSSAPETLVAELAKIPGSRQRAKIRTGGVTAELIPTPEQVAAFIQTCASHRVPFKATAGLHHPLRRLYPLTYEPHAARAVMHGFLNVFLASTRAWSQNVSRAELVDLLQLSSASEIHISNAGISGPNWHLSSTEIENTRRQFAIAFGSCSFTEPIDDLCQMKLLTTSS